MTRLAMFVLSLVVLGCASDTITHSTQPDAIIFTSSADRPAGALYFLALDGSQPVQLPDTAKGISCPVVSPDGKRIVYERGVGAALSLATSGLDGRNIVAVTSASFVANPPPSGNGGPNTYSIGCPGWSPDSQRLAVFRFFLLPFETGVSDLYTMNADGSSLLRVTSGNVFDAVEWSTAGNLLLDTHQYSHGGTHDYAALVMSAAGAGMRSVTTSASGIAWSPLGDKIAVICGKPFVTARVCVGDLNGPVSAITDSTVTASNPAWSPDGSRLAFGCRFALCVIKPDGTAFQQLASNATFASNAKWSPDSKRMTYSCLPLGSQAPSAQGICIIDADGTNERTLVATTGENSSVSWVPGAVQ